MSLRTRFYRPWLWSAAVVLLAAGPLSAQPPSPLDLVRALRDQGMTDLATKALDVLEGKPLPPNDPDAGLTIFQAHPLSDEDKAALSLERAKALLEGSEDEPDQGTRRGMVLQAEEALNSFLSKSPNHPRRAEGLLAEAKLLSAKAREKLNDARRIDVPTGENEKAAAEAAREKQKVEAAKAQPLFTLAAKRYEEASKLLRARLEDKDKPLEPAARKSLEREAFEAELAAGINHYNNAETFMGELNTKDKEQRNKYLETAKDVFSRLDKGGTATRTTWMARAWIYEVTFEQDDRNTAAEQLATITKSGAVEANDGKRLVRFFQIRRNYADAIKSGDSKLGTASLAELLAWLQAYDPQYYGAAKLTPEVFAVRFYRARLLHLMAVAAINPKAGPGTEVKARLAASEQLYRKLTQTDNDYTARAAKYRLQVVRLRLGDATAPPYTYNSFEDAQMASLIQLGNMATEEAKPDADPAKVQALRMSAIALLERARELIPVPTPPDVQPDAIDTLLRLIVYYQAADLPYQSAILGEHVARTMPARTAGGKGSAAGYLALNGYALAAQRLRLPPAASEDEQKAFETARKVDRERAIALARYLDEKYPNDTATDAARFRLGAILTDENRLPEAFAALLKVRPAFAGINNVRLLEGYLAAQLIGKDSTLNDAQKLEVYQRALADLSKAAKPANIALEDDVRAYITARTRWASLLFSQGRVDKATEAARPGYEQALAAANELLGSLTSFDCLVVKGTKKLNLDGLEMELLALDIQARATYLQARALITAGRTEEAAAKLEPALKAIGEKGSAVTAEMKAWGEAGAGDDAAQKAKILKIAAAVDKTRIEVILSGFRLRVEQGKAAEAGPVLDLITKVGGTIEENLPLLEALGRESAARMLKLRKDGKAKEAQEVGAGLAVLLNKVRGVQSLTPRQKLFIGETLVSVGEYGPAIESLKEVPPPEFPDWKTTSPAGLIARIKEIEQTMRVAEEGVIRTLPPEEQDKAKDAAGRPEVVAQKVVPVLREKEKAQPKPNEKPADIVQREKETALAKAYFTGVTELPEAKKKLEEARAFTRANGQKVNLEQLHPGQMSAYSAAQLAIARALRLDKRFQDSEKMLNEIIGTQDKRGWGWTRIAFRKELAFLYEDRAPFAPNQQAALAEWRRGQEIWSSLFATQRTQLSKAISPLPPLPPLKADATDKEKEQRAAEEEKRAAELERRKAELPALKNAYTEAFFDLQRYVIVANSNLFKNNPPKLAETVDKVGQSLVDIEKQVPNVDEWDAEIQNKYVDFAKETPGLLAAYTAKAAQVNALPPPAPPAPAPPKVGKLFLERKPLPTAP